MDKHNKISILVCILITSLNIVACGQVKKDEIVNTDESATSQQESNVQTVEQTALEIENDKTVNQQENNAKAVENTDSKAKEAKTVNTEESAVNEQENSKQPVWKTTDDISGGYVYPIDNSTLSITSAADGSYSAELNLVRLASIDDFTGKYENGILTMTGTDPAGNPITAEITFSNEQVTLTFTDSIWEYLENGTQYVFNKE